MDSVFLTFLFTLLYIVRFNWTVNMAYFSVSIFSLLILCVSVCVFFSSIFCFYYYDVFRWIFLWVFVSAWLCPIALIFSHIQFFWVRLLQFYYLIVCTIFPMRFRSTRYYKYTSQTNKYTNRMFICCTCEFILFLWELSGNISIILFFSFSLFFCFQLHL